MKKLLITATAFIALINVGNSQTATEIIQKAESKRLGKSSYTEMTMTIQRPKWSRTISFKGVSKGTDYSLTLITSPVKEKGQTFMKQKDNIWSWNPKIGRLIKLPPSMMTQGWMGSDFSNDDLLKENSLSEDYNHKIIGEAEFSGYDCYKIELKPKSDVPVIWGKIIMFISKKENMFLQSMYYDDDEYLVKTEKAYNIKEMDGRLLPTKFELIPEENPGNKTILELVSVKFDVNVQDNFFSQQQMKRSNAIKFPQK